MREISGRARWLSGLETVFDRLRDMKKFTLSAHAIKRIKKRKIKIEWIETALNHPARTENDSEDSTLVHALLAVPERGFNVLRVIYNETVDPVTVVTVFFDDEATDL